MYNEVIYKGGMIIEVELTEEGCKDEYNVMIRLCSLQRCCGRWN